MRGRSALPALICIALCAALASAAGSKEGGAQAQLTVATVNNPDMAIMQQLLRGVHERYRHQAQFRRASGRTSCARRSPRMFGL